MLHRSASRDHAGGALQLQTMAVIENVVSCLEGDVVHHEELVRVQSTLLRCALFSCRSKREVPADQYFECFIFLIYSGLDPEPRGIERGKEQQDQHRAYGRAADQRIGHRSPEDGVRQGDEGQHGGNRGEDHGPRPC